VQRLDLLAHQLEHAATLGACRDAVPRSGRGAGEAGRRPRGGPRARSSPSAAGGASGRRGDGRGDGRTTPVAVASGAMISPRRGVQGAQPGRRGGWRTGAAAPRALRGGRPRPRASSRGPPAVCRLHGRRPRATVCTSAGLAASRAPERAARRGAPGRRAGPLRATGSGPTAWARPPGTRTSSTTPSPTRPSGPSWGSSWPSVAGGSPGAVQARGRTRRPARR